MWYIVWNIQKPTHRVLHPPVRQQSHYAENDGDSDGDIHGDIAEHHNIHSSLEKMADLMSS